MSRDTSTALHSGCSSGVLSSLPESFAITRLVLVCIIRWRPRAPPTISSIVYNDHDCYCELPVHHRGGRVPTQPNGLILRPRNDSSRPAYELRLAVRTAAARAASSTTAPPICARPSPWPALCVCAPPAGDSPAATVHRSAPRSARLRPKVCASWCCLVC